ncbi:phosphoadenosine phosphosulfate reductase [Thalassococcus profundi]|uniref:Phosphoadenosine phosphosulfate reductase n=1 Tax=Thalassococcus profundi TaxID=2282382 RepID=A0A369TRB7_9RHOB|nr:phosphoadenosine phosphosulfate reductase [Thalassococcus profundi]RDD66657.1 phosphoadenosine phosphosulfate reductase [Thalassococcus profundi]
MSDIDETLTLDLTGLRTADWLAALSELGQSTGFFEQLGKRHAALFIDEGDTLLVSFESIPGVQALSDDGAPLGFDLVRSQGWSHLCLLSDGDTWFRDQRIYGFFDQLNDDGFFDDFERVIFFGAGSCGYAAAAYSVAAPGARVVALQPQASLDPRVSEWDDRFARMRRLSFTDRYGYAPDMIDAADRAFILYDPREPLDAMHSALFTRRNVTRFRLPSMGGALQGDLIELDLLTPIIVAAADGTLDTARFAAMMRVRRQYAPYLRKLLARLEAHDRPGLAEMLCRNVTSRMHAPRFQRKLEGLRAARKAAQGNADPEPAPEPEPPAGDA